MRLPTLLLLLLVIAFTAGAAWYLLGGSPASIETEDDDPLSSPEQAPSQPAEAVERRPPPRPAIVELPAERQAPRVAILAADFQLPPPDYLDRDAMFRLHETRLPGDAGTLNGEELVRAVGEAVRIRFRSEADLKAIQRLGPDPDWPRDQELTFNEIVDHWRRSGFEAELAGEYLIVSRQAD